VKTYWIVMRFRKWSDVQVSELHGLFPSVNLTSGIFGDVGYLPIFETRDAAEAASDGGKYPIAELHAGEVAP
jgi:hypothetical protein